MKKLFHIMIFALTVLVGCNFCMQDTTSVEAAAAQTTTKTSVSKKTTTKTVKMKKKASRSKKSTSTSTVTKPSKTVTSSSKKVTEQVTVKTVKLTTDKKGSVKRTIKTTVTTTTKKTIVTYATKAAAPVVTNLTADSMQGRIGNTQIIQAFKDMGFEVVINANAATAGNFNPTTKKITLKTADASVLNHEFGHFLAYLTTTFPDFTPADDTKEFRAIYAAEKDLFKGTNKAYVISTNHEYFAESFKDFCEEPGNLKAQRPQTYEYIARVAASVDSTTADTASAWFGIL